MNSPLCYVGGKSKLSKIIVPSIPAHKTYCEVFAGAAWIFFKKEPSLYEVINDLDGELVSFYRVLQNHLEEFLKQFKWLLSSREWYEDWNRQLKAGGLTDIQKAARYYYVQRLSFGGKVGGRTYGTPIESQVRINLVRMEEELSSVHLRLARVNIENLNWSVIVAKYDKPTTFFYLDPPYYKSPLYNHNFYNLSDYKEIAIALSKIKGKFILSINDLPEIRELFSDFHMQAVKLDYSIRQKQLTVGKELLISNFKR